MSVSIAVGLRRFLAAPANLAAFDDDVGVVARPVDLDLPEAQELRLHRLAHAVLTTLRSLPSPRAEAALSCQHPGPSRKSIQRSGRSSATVRCRANGGPPSRTLGPASPRIPSNRDSTKTRTRSIVASST